MRIVFNARREVAHPLSGGSEVLVDRLATGLADRGHDVTVSCAGPIGDHPYRAVVAGGPLSQFALAPLHHRRRFRDHDLVVDVSNGLVAFTPLWRSGPVLCLVNHIHTPQWAQWFPAPVAAAGRLVERRVMPLVYRKRPFVAVSRSTSDALVGLGVDPARIRIVHNGVDVLRGALPEESPSPLFVALGRLVPHKRYDRLLELWSEVRHAVGGRLVVMGEGPERARLQAMRVPDVELPGHVDELTKRALLRSAWLLVHPSELEGWGIAIMEAAACGTPALGYAVPGVQDAVVDGVSGVLAADDGAFAGEWIDLVRDSARRRLLRKGALERATEFSWERAVSEFEAVALEVVAEHGRAP